MTGRPESAEPSAMGEATDIDTERTARPTYAPAAMALGITLLLWGLVTSPVVLGAGAVVIGVSLVGWIGEMRHEQ